jgi:hypothetical protein
MQEVEKEGLKPFARERGWGDPNHTTAQKLWHSIFYTPFTAVRIIEKDRKREHWDS